MPAYAVLDIDPRKERASVFNALGPRERPIIKFDGMTGHIRIACATDEELEIIAAMFNAIGERAKADGTAMCVVE